MSEEKFQTCKYRSLEKVASVSIETSCCGNYKSEAAFYCWKMNIHGITEERCAPCAYYQKRAELKIEE